MTVAPEVPAGRSSSLTSGVIWNLASLGFLALAGLALNIIIGRFYGAPALGLFNICFAGLIFLSQIGSFGQQFSVLQAVSEHAGRDQDALNKAVGASLVVTVIAATLTTLVALALTPLVAVLFRENDMATAWLVMMPGLWAFCLNKFLYGVINGARHMRAFAILQSLRFVLILASVVLLLALHVPPEWLTMVFTLSEVIIAPVLLIWARRAVTRVEWPSTREWRQWHVSFGARSFLSGAALELNTRVDVLIIGAMLGAAETGIYSVALLITEGVAQIIFVLRNNINPLLTRYLADRDALHLLAFSRRMGAIATGLLAAASIFAVLVFPLFVDIALGGGDYTRAAVPLQILLAWLTFSAAGQSFGMILALAKRPALHTAYVVVVLTLNVVLNLLFVPVWGVLGSAWATGASYAVSAVLAIILARTLLGLRIIL